MNHEILETFSSQLRAVFARSIDTAWELQQESIPPVFLLWSISVQEGCAGADILKKYALTSESIRAQFPLERSHTLRTEEVRNPGETKTMTFLWPEFSTHTKRIIERGAIIAFELQHGYVGTEHLLLALIERADETIAALLNTQQLNVAELTQHIIMTMRSAQALHDIQHVTSMKDGSMNARTTTVQKKNEANESETPALDFFGTDLTSPTQQQRLTPVIGRGDEINRLIHILARKTKNNPVLIGDPGVGKTAIVEGLAQRIVEGSVPDVLLGKRIVSLDLTSMISGTMYRGDYESRIKAVIEELKEHPEVIVFIDELHTIIGAGSATPGSLDTAHMLKPPLARGELRCIGATTIEEYRKHIEADSALERRFQPITVEESTPEATLHILKGVQKSYANFHHVTYTPEAIHATITYAARYLPDRHFPDKAIDILDEAGAMKRSGQPHSEEQKTIQSITSQLRDVRQNKMRAIKAERLEEAAGFKKTEDGYVAQLKELHSTLTEPHRLEVTESDVATVVAAMCHVPVAYLNNAHTTSTHSLERTIEKRVFGQHEAVHNIVSIIERSLAGLQSEQRPLASVLCYGPAGVGKTTLAQTLATELFHSPDSLLHLNMSEFSEGFSITKILGAPAGYVGHKDTIKFIDHIRRHPYSVVLCDEIEKAHPDVMGLFIQMMNQGKITDGTGRTILCNHTIFIFTANIAEETFTKQAELGFALGDKTPAKKIEKRPIKLTEYFSSELLSSLDAHIAFEALSQRSVEHIVRHHLTQLNTRLKKSELNIQLTKRALAYIAKKGFTPETGARGIAQTLIQEIEQPLASGILNKTFTAGNHITVDCVKEKLAWDTRTKKTTAPSRNK